MTTPRPSTTWPRTLWNASQKDLAIIDEHLTKTVVRAPFDCTVLTRPVSMGQAVSGSGGFNSGTEVLTIADLNSMIINAQVNQADVPRLKVGETVEVTIEAVAGLQATGVVERISPQATIKNNIKGYPARIVLKNVDPRIRPGMTANVKIPVASAENVTAVPLAAVFTEKNPETGQMERFVYVQQGDTFEKRNVKVGVFDFFFAEIQEGLKPGEIVSLELPKDEREKNARPPGWRTRRPQSGRCPGRSGPNRGRHQCWQWYRVNHHTTRQCVRKSDRPAQSALTGFEARSWITFKYGPRRTPQCQQDLPPWRGGNPRPGRRHAGHRGG